MAEKEKTYVWFDWAVKRMLRNKANFEVLEGLFQVMTGKDAKILEVLESEGNKESELGKYNRVDVKARTSDGETVIIEVQVIREMDFLERILFGVAKAVTEQIQEGDPYSKIRKVYSINIVYFDLGVGDDYVYHGQTKLIGMNTADELMISGEERAAIENKAADELFPEYYIVRVKKFNPGNTISPTDLEQWMEYLKTGKIRKEYNAPGLAKARERLAYDSMTSEEKKEYRDHIDFVRSQQFNLDINREEGIAIGKEEGIAIGKEEGIAIGKEMGKEEGIAIGKEMGKEEGIAIGKEEGREELKQDIARKMLAKGMSPELVRELTGLT